MGFRQQRFSDVSGELLDDEKVVTVIIKGHEAAGGESKIFDTSDEELKALKTVSGLIELEVKNGGPARTVFVTKAELAKFVTDEQIKSFDSARGRRSNFRPGVTGS